MSRKLIIALAALALAAFGLTACGGDDEEEATTDAATSETTTEQTTTDETTGGGGGGGGGTIEPVADPGGALEYQTGTLDVQANGVTIEFDNPSSVPHDVNIETPDGETIGGTDVITDDSTTTTVDVTEPGEYTYYCSVANHRAAGMEETLIVE